MYETPTVAPLSDVKFSGTPELPRGELLKRIVSYRAFITLPTRRIQRKRLKCSAAFCRQRENS